MSGTKCELKEPNAAYPAGVLLGRAFPAASYRGGGSRICAWEPNEVPRALERIDEAVRAGKDVAGYLAYELGYVLEPRLAALLPRDRLCPLILMGVFDGASETPHLPPLQSAPGLGPIDARGRVAAFESGVERILELIRAGDVYQVNLTYPLDFEIAGDAGGLYEALLDEQPVPYSAIVNLGGPLIVSLSPELFFRIEHGRILARPMKGTAPRARTLCEDERAARALRRDPKNRAENLMITDLLRNDLAKVSRPGSVRVPELFTIETYRTLHTLTSTVEADLAAGTLPSDIIRALFPCGSVTGAPKIRAMEIIRELEAEPRGIYTGAIGVFRGDGSACFNVAIRTLAIDAEKARLGVGGGIVAESGSEAEAAETRLKARFLTARAEAGEPKPFGLIETFAWRPGGYHRLERHLARLAESALFFQIPLDLAALRQMLQKRALAFTRPMRVRLALAADGCVELSAGDLEASALCWRCRLSDKRIASSDVYRAHKTTRRSFYDTERARALAEGFDEVLFLNERGELAEGSIANVFLERDGVLLTPPIASGALPGILRAELLDQGHAKECTLTLADLAEGTLYLGNSLRGLIPANLAPRATTEM